MVTFLFGYGYFELLQPLVKQSKNLSIFVNNLTKWTVRKFEKTEVDF